MSILGQINFYEIFNWFEDIGGFDLILPFLLVFAVTFAILKKIGLFGTDDKKASRINGVVSLIMAFFLVSQTSLVEVLQGFLPRVSMIVLVLLMVLLVVGIFSKSTSWESPALGIGVVVALGSVLWAIGAAAGWDVPLRDFFTEQDIAVLLMVGVFILVIWMIIKEPKEGGGSGGAGDAIKKFFDSFKGSSGG